MKPETKKKGTVHEIVILKETRVSNPRYYLVVVLVINLLRAVAVVSPSPVGAVVLAVGVQRTRSSRLSSGRRVVWRLHSRALYIQLVSNVILVKEYLNNLPVKQRGPHMTVLRLP